MIGTFINGVFDKESIGWNPFGNRFGIGLFVAQICATHQETQIGSIAMYARTRYASHIVGSGSDVVVVVVIGRSRRKMIDLMKA